MIPTTQNRSSETRPDNFIARDLEDEEQEKTLKGGNRNNHTPPIYLLVNELEQAMTRPPHGGLFFRTMVLRNHQLILGIEH
jgi:hypothetical protein